MSVRALAGMVPLSEVARHWTVRSETAKQILDRHGKRPLLRCGRRYYTWIDIWSVEGAPQVAPEDYEAYRQPLLDKHDVARRYGHSERTARRQLSDGDLPGIRLSDHVLRAREIDLDRHDEAHMAVWAGVDAGPEKEKMASNQEESPEKGKA